VAKIINDKGCLPAGEEWLERNLLVVAGVAVGIAFLQVCLDLIISKAWKNI
jgi:tetraspanin-5